MPKKIITIIAIAFFLVGILWYVLVKRENERAVTKDISITSKPFISWQKITTTIEEEKQTIVITTNTPKIIIPERHNLGGEINQAVKWYIESLRNEFISGVSTAAENNGETNTLDINAEVLLATPRLLSLAFMATEHMAGINDQNPERTFIVFDLGKGGIMMQGIEPFRNDLAWSRAAQTMKQFLLAGYQGDPSCDLSFAPKQNGLSASCIGVDWSRSGQHVSIIEDIPLAMIQEFLDPQILSDIIQ